MIASGAMSAAIAPLGAELRWLRDGDGHDVLWDGDPAYWTGRAPILFPIVGSVAGGAIRIGGIAYPLAQHGFARRRDFAIVEQGGATATFRLAADAATRAAYPFDFTLDVRFALAGAALTVTSTLANPAGTPLPASLGYHPALRWPLPYGGARADHIVRFERAEPAPIRRIDADALVRPDPLPTPVAGRDLALDDALFVDGALIFDRPVSRQVTYGVPGRPGLAISYPDMPMLGLWTKPGADFLCIEPWAGVADPAGFTGEFRDKPGVIAVPPGGSRDFTMRIERVARIGD